MSSAINHVCENCGHDNLSKFIDEPGQLLLHCSNCDLFQKGALESQLVYAEAYHEEYFKRLGSKKATAKIRLGSIKPYLKMTGLDSASPKMLDIGCSIGATLSAAVELGWQPTGVDVSQRAVDACTERGLDCHLVEGLEIPFGDNTFDLVTNWHVLEHVADVKETLTEWQRVLKPGGVMILETPDARYLKARMLGTSYKKFWPSEHLYAFNRKNLESILDKTGFEILPNRLIGSWTALSPALTTYAIGYRSFRTVCRRFRMCKSLEICCRKPLVAPNDYVDESITVA